MADAAKPLLALAIGDPAGVGPELAAKLIADSQVRAAANLVVIGDARVLRRGAEVAGVAVDLPVVTSSDALRPDRSVLMDLGHLDPATIKLGVAVKAGGQFALENFRTGLRLAAAGTVGGVCFTPFNKAAMRMAHPSYDDEIGFVAGVLDIHTPASEFNILEGLWNARVTSHVPLSAVAGLVTRERVLRSLVLTYESLRNAGIDEPRIGVAALNPHAGDGGNFGHEDDDEIAPAVADAKARGIGAIGPYPPDTVFVRATKGEFDAVLTMYHDQGQIAMKLIGFDRGVTLIGGFPFPICTPAHGSAYDIAGKGIANLGASRAALLIAARAAVRQAQR
ncbi:MAG TPA: 4-hydroxythreonine-4-phosphate dehydrogenase [Acetobacteraceae bacterium]|jgi:4-hydroxythreonine-4-phosphate dehydrogenase|nr:4-hydroxythreonine-4-phosphate dehydrogenase [Acetobacteraceae bacterium]